MFLFIFVLISVLIFIFVFAHRNHSAVRFYSDCMKISTGDSHDV